MISFLKISTFLLTLTLSTSLYAVDEKTTVDNFDAFRLEGMYQIETTDYSADAPQRRIPINQLTVYRNKGTETYTAALSNDKLDQAVVVFREMSATFLEAEIFLSSEMKLEGQFYGKMEVKFNRETLDVRGRLLSSDSTGYKLFSGKPVYTLSMCLFKGPTEYFEFPSIEDLEGEYIDEAGHKMILRKFSSGVISMVIKLFVIGEYHNMTHDSGHYYSEVGLLAFPWNTGELEGIVNVSYRIDNQGKPYLKAFSLTSAGRHWIKKFYFHKKLLPIGDF